MAVVDSNTVTLQNVDMTHCPQFAGPDAPQITGITKANPAVVTTKAAHGFVDGDVVKFTDVVGSGIEAALATAGDSDYEAVHGMTPTSQAALLMRRYMHEYNVPHTAFAGFPVTAHANAVHNPNAMFRSAISADTYNRAGVVSDPLTMFDVAPVADGAAALILARTDVLPPGFTHPLVYITGSSMATDRLALHDRPDPLAFTAVRTSVERACRLAGILPGDVDLFEMYDAYSIFALLSLEAAGFAARGCGWQMAQNGHTTYLARCQSPRWGD